METIGTYTPDSLIADGLQLHAVARTQAAGLITVRGQLVGLDLLAIGTPDPGPGNTGEGTMTAALGQSASRPATYRAECIAPAAGGDPAVFSLYRGAQFLCNVNADGAAFAHEDISVTITEAGAAFIAGDSFEVEVEAGSGQIVPADSRAANGAQRVYGIVCRGVDTDDGGEPLPVIVYTQGVFDSGSLVMSWAGDDLENFRRHAESVGIYFRHVTAA